MSVFVEVDPEGEENVIRVHRLAVGEFQTLAQDEGVGEPVGRDLPGFGHRGFGELSDAIDVDEIGLHDANDFAGPRVGGDQRIQGFWFTAQRNDEAPAWAADFAGEDEQFVYRIILLRVERGWKKTEYGKSQERPEKNPVAHEHSGAVSHARLPRLLLSILYALERSCNALGYPKYPRKNGTMARAGRYIHQ